MKIKFLMVQKLCLFLLSALLLLSPSISFAKLTQSIDRTDIHAGESFLLTLQVDEDTGAEPDLSLIPKEFTIVSNSQYQQMSYVNGRSSIIKGWKIKLSTLATGKITIPPIPVGKDTSNAVILFIKDTSDRVDLNGQKKAIYLESKVDQTEGYVQQQVIFTVKLYRAVNTHYARLTEPSAGESIIEKLGDDVQYDKTIDETRYVVTERRYAIFPQKSGELTIDAINFTADINDPSRRNTNRFLNTTRPISVNSKAIKVKVLAQPAKAATPWMPATEVVLADKWSSNSNELTVGEPVTWTILLYAQGLSEAQLPEVSLPKINGLQFYPDTAQKERQINERGILGQRIEKLAVIPSKEGTITIPEISIKWWDTQSNSEKSATIAAKTFTVLPGQAALNNQPKPEKIGPQVEQKIVENEPSTFYWKSAAISLLVIWLLTLLALVRSKNDPDTISGPRIKRAKKEASTPAVTQSERYKRLRNAIKAQQVESIERHLVDWASSLSNTSIHSLGHLASELNDSQLANKILALEAFRYAANKDSYQCDISKQDLAKIETSLVTKIKGKNQQSIPPLYSN